MFQLLPKIPLLVAAITSVSEMRKAAWSDCGQGKEFSLTCTVASAITSICSYVVRDETGYGCVRATNNIILAAGDRVHLRGHIAIDKYNWQRAIIDSSAYLSKGEVPPGIRATAASLYDISFDNKNIILRGVVADIADDEIDPNWRFLVLRSKEGPFLCAVCCGNTPNSLDSLLGATVDISGRATVLPDGGTRKFKTPQLTVASPDDIKTVVPPPTDPFDAPKIPSSESGVENFQYQSATLLSRMERRRADGQVIAVLRDNRILMRTENGQMVGAEITNEAMPKNGENISVAGFPETDLFIIKLAKAVYRTLPQSSTDTGEEYPLPLDGDFSMPDILRDQYGKLLRITGKIIPSHSDPKASSPAIVLACGRHAIPVDTTSLGNGISLPQPGSKVTVTGICVPNSAKWNPLDIFPRTDGFLVAPRKPADIAILSSPPWWTTRRLVVVIATLIILLTLVFIWNGILRHLIERRSRQLLKAEIAQAESKLRISERTRLAIELHDAVSQTLTGIAFQVDAAQKTLHENPPEAEKFLAFARKTLLSCREELRRCIWDLRHDALESSDFAKALKQTITPCIGDVAVAIRFKLRRSQISDSTAHAIMNMIRELTVNAVRHGKARHIWIAGGYSSSKIYFSVKDDGCGFNPDERPGPAQGHFGLQGIKERIAKFGGTMEIASTPGKGTKISLEMGR